MSLFLISGAKIVIYTNRPLETSIEERQVDATEVSDRLHWSSFLGLDASAIGASVYTRQVNSNQI
ncbi:MAG: hypothetical protein DCF19_16175 [Pseudanabaena frigida]|uniref:Uncharacterized protein n=1 Tax=Pseudanabaena frigida TaxID=945775 RepID=A0A2W4W2E9_9CYAN|nr:MAG: hypothetical protein DCF19_16175 [Pseudanabaena frigida]